MCMAIHGWTRDVIVTMSFMDTLTGGRGTVYVYGHPWMDQGRVHGGVGVQYMCIVIHGWTRDVTVTMSLDEGCVHGYSHRA